MIHWRERMSVDDGGVIDQDHRHLIEIINRFNTLAADGLDREEALEIAYALKFYTHTHFRREEHLQRLISFPFAEEHKHEHEMLIDRLDGVIAHLNDDNVDIDEQTYAEMTAMLRDWLIDHILENDLKMRPYVDRLKAASPGLGALSDIEVDV